MIAGAANSPLLDLQLKPFVFEKYSVMIEYTTRHHFWEKHEGSHKDDW